MGRTCPKCSAPVPNHVVIDGKRRNTQNRKFCLNCSPFGSHNTKNLVRPEVPVESPPCAECGRDIPANRRNGRRCYMCVQKVREQRIVAKVYGLVGTKCWLCPYDRGLEGTPVLDFHHMTPEQKSFGLDLRRMTNLSWDRVFNEMQKCSLLCCRCHREIERGLADENALAVIYEERWKEIRAHS